MKRTLFRTPTLLSLTLGVALLNLSAPVAQTGQAPNVKKQAQQSVEKGLSYLRSVQETDGSWSNYPATTALACAAFLRNGRTEVKDPAVAKGIQYILRSAKPNGAIYSDANPSTALPNYNTCLCVMALALTKNPAYKPTIQKAQQYLEQSQFDEGESISPTDPMYGGVGYGSKPDRPDLSNLQMALEALKESGTGPNSPVWKKAIIFLQRVQNRQETNDQAWVKEAGVVNDGGFIYDTKGRSDADGVSGGKHSSYGAMSYAGLKSYIYAGVDKKDPRTQAAWNWIRSHYTVTEHPGMKDASLYYFYHTMAKTFDVYGDKIVQDTKGGKHDWSQDLAKQLITVQHPDGSWYNNNSRYWENQPPLVTSYSLIAMSYCLKQLR
jgi:squalene-hopene/tetraprenyl-beta-curcumene cyclase